MNAIGQFGFMVIVWLWTVGSISTQEGGGGESAHRGPAAFSVTAIYAVTVPESPPLGSGGGSGAILPPAPREGTGDGSGGLGQSIVEVTPPVNQIECQQPVLTEEEQIARQQQAARDLDKAVVGLEIAQGAIEITLGAIRIAAASTTAEVLRREDAIASAQAAAATAIVGFEGQGTSVPLEPIRRDEGMSEAEKKAVCALARRRTQSHQSDDPYSAWNNAYHQRMKRSSLFGPMIISEEAHNFVKPVVLITPDPRRTKGGGSSDFNSVKLPTTDEADHLLNLLENLLDTNNEVLRLLNIDLPPLTNQPSNPGAVLLRQYRQRLEQQRANQKQYGETGYIEENTTTQDVFGDRSRWKTGGGGGGGAKHRPDVRTLTSELAQLNRMRRRLNVE